MGFRGKLDRFSIFHSETTTYLSAHPHTFRYSRGYSEKKIQENIEAEIMQVCADEARASYQAEIIKELRSDSVEDLESNVEALATWIESVDNGSG